MKNKRLNIGLLVGPTTSPYSERVMFGVNDFCKENDINLITFAGAPYNAPDSYNSKRYLAFNLANPDYLDGIIITIGPLKRHTSDAEMKKILKRYNKLPILSIGGSIEGIPNLTPDYKQAIFDLMDHLIKVHNCRKTLLVRGVKGHYSSQVREEAYIESLKKHNIDIDKNLIVYADLNKGSAIKSIEEVFAKDIKFDSVVTMTEPCATGVIDVLNKKGLNVPNEIIVCGFNSSYIGLLANPSLTTVNEPTYDIGYQSAGYLLKMINGEKISDEIFFKTDLIIRESCGCKKNEEIALTAASKDNLPACSFIKKFDSIKNEIIETMIEETNLYFIDKKILITQDRLEILLKSLYDDFKIGSLSTLKQETDKIFSENHSDEENLLWFNIFTVLENKVLNFINTNEELQIFKEIFITLNMFLKPIKEKFYLTQSNYLNKHTKFFREFSHLLNLSFSFDQFKDVFNRVLDIEDFLIVLYENYKDDSWEFEKLIFGTKEKEIIKLKNEAELYESFKYLPQLVSSYDKRISLMLQPMQYKKEPVGYIILNISVKNGSIYEALQAEFSFMIQNQIQYDKIKDGEERFYDIAQSVSEWLWEVDSNGIFIYSSNGVEKILGYKSGEIIGKSMFDFLQPTEMDYMHNVRDILIPKKSPLDDLLSWNTHKNGFVVGLLISAKPIFRQDGSFKGYRGIFKDITEAKLQEEKIKFLAFYDLLTGLPNRTLFHDRLENVARQASREKTEFAVFFIDLDHFKQVNDTMGHDAGDELLRIVSIRLKNCITTADTFARLAGDEFTMLIPNVKKMEDLFELGDKIVNAMNTPLLIKGRDPGVTASIGISVFPGDTENIELLLKNADKAMYFAKNTGKNNFAFYNQELEKKSKHYQKVTRIITGALDKNELHIFYQPIVQVKSKKLTGFEMMLKIENPEIGSIMPSDFLPILEKMNLIIQFGNWIFNKLSIKMNEFERKDLQKLKIVVNFSGKQFLNNLFYGIFFDIIKQKKIDPNFLEVVINEDGLFENEEASISAIKKLKEMGVKITLEGFCRKHTALNFLDKYPINSIKLDRSIITGISKNDNSFLNAVDMMAKNLGLKVIADGVENETEYQSIIGICDEAQGSYFSEPLTSDDVLGVLKNF